MNKIQDHGSIKKKIREFENLEKKFHLDKYRIFNIYWWDGIRYSLSRNILYPKQEENNKKPKRSKSFFYYFKRFNSLFLNSFTKSPLKTKKRSIIIFSNSRRIKGIKNSTDMVSDPFIDLLSDEMDYALLEGTISGIHNSADDKYKIFYLDLFFLVAKFITLIIKPIVKYRSILQNKLIKQFTRQLIINYQNDFKLKKRIIDYVSNTYSLYLVALFFLKYKKPTHLFFVDSNAFHGFILAGKALNIPTIELQHGSPTKGKLNYDYSSGISKKAFPDWFATFGEFWFKKNILPIQDNKLIHFGFPFFYNNISKHKKKMSKNSFLIISQLGLTEEMVSFAIELRKYLPENVQIIFKAHPLEIFIIEKYKRKLIRNSIIIPEVRSNIYFLFEQSNWQLGVYSTALYEGLLFGLKTYILKAKGWEFVEELIKEDLATLVFDPKEVNILKKQKIVEPSILFKKPNHKSLQNLLKITENN